MDAPSRKVLLVTYTFPPQYDVSARRAAKLCKYLPAAGWQPIVLTKDWASGEAAEDRRAYSIVSHPAALDELSHLTIVRTRYRTHDNSLRRWHERLGGVYGGAEPREAAITGQRGTGAGTRVAAPPRWTPRAVARRTLSLLSPTFGDFPDPFRGWVAEAVRAGVDVVRREPVDAICSLCPPASAHVVASEIARQTGVPWVAQFDDLYSFHLERTRPEWRWYADQQHRRWMSQASAAGAITPAMLAYVQRTYALDGDVVVVGFDPDDQPPVRQGRPRERLRLAYTGSVYPGDQRPEMLFEGLDRALASWGSEVPPVELILAGTSCDLQLRSLLRAYPRAERVCVLLDRLSPADALGLQRESDALVLLNLTSPSADEGTLSFPAKTFEYLNARRPILAIPSDPGGWGDRLLRSTGAGTTVNSTEECARVLLSWIREWTDRHSLPYHGKPDAIAEYSQPRQAAVLGGLLTRAASQPTP